MKKEIRIKNHLDELERVNRFVGGQLLVGSPKEGNVQPPMLLWQKHLLLQPVCLAQLPLDAVTLDGSLEITLRDRHHDAHHPLLIGHEDGTDGVGRHGLMPAAEQFFEHLAAA